MDHPTSRRIASGRVRGASCCAIQSSKAANSAGGIRTWMGVAPTNGRPRPRFFLVLDIDVAINNWYQKMGDPRNSRRDLIRTNGDLLSGLRK